MLIKQSEGMKSFLNRERPIITAMLKSSNTKALISEIERGAAEGAEAFGFQIEMLESSCRKRTDFLDIFQAMGNRPAYVTNYMRGNISLHKQSDEELTEELLLALECGATLCDVRGDLYDPCVGELSLSDRAVEKQMNLIKEIHRMGGEVLMSSHIFNFLPKEHVYMISKTQQERGADIAKVVTMANSEEELDENFEALLLLKKKMQIPTLFLCNGTMCYKHRILGPMLGSCMYLTVESGIQAVTQPHISEARKVLIAAGYKL